MRTLRSNYERERAENFQLFETKIRKAQNDADERLGQLKYLPQKIDRANDAVENNKVSMCEVFVFAKIFFRK